MSKKIVVIGSSNTDMVVKSSHLPRAGETVIGDYFMMTHGGKGANQAVAASRLGGNVIFIAKVGNDVFGRNSIEMFSKEGINPLVSISEKMPSGVALINVDDKGENCIAVASGANLDLSISDIEKVEATITSAEIVLMQLEIPMETVVYAAQLAKKQKVTVILNPAPAPKKSLPDDLLSNIDVLIPNETEAELISNISIKDMDSARLAILKIIEKGVKTVILTLGSNGALAYDNSQFIHVPAFKVNSIDTTAAGDTFCGALCVALTEGKSLEESIRFANKAASISVTRMGAQSSIPYRNEVFSETSTL